MKAKNLAERCFFNPSTINSRGKFLGRLQLFFGLISRSFRYRRESFCFVFSFYFFKELFQALVPQVFLF